MIIKIYFEEALEIVKNYACKFYQPCETEKNKLVIYDIKSVEFGWIFSFQNYYGLRLNEELCYFSNYPIFIDKFDGELVQYHINIDYLNEYDFIQKFCNDKYPNYLKEKANKEVGS
jgi:hypothetical protein